jgi:uncharacterized integral membrane protein (TIGR00698 family)
MMLDPPEAAVKPVDRVARALVVIGALACVVPDGVMPVWRAMPPWVGLLMGIGIALAVGNPFLSRTRPVTPRLLQVCVVGLGASMDLRVVARVGLHGFATTFLGIAAALTAGAVLGRALGVPRATATLLSVGTAICGGSAIAAAAPVIGADEDETSVSLATVFVLNAVALLLFPLLGHMLGMGERAFGLWAALAIHDTSSVVGAASSYGREALVVATTTKLARALWIVPVTLGLGAWVRQRGPRSQQASRQKYPWFVLGFLVASALVTFAPALRVPGAIVAEAARRGLVLTLFLLGLGINKGSLVQVGARPLLQGVLLWLLVGAGSLAAIVSGLAA